MFLNESPVLTGLKALVDGLTLSPALSAVHIVPDDTLSIDAYTVPFGLVGMMEDSDKTMGQTTFGVPNLRYSVYIRIYVNDGVILPNTKEFDTFLNTARPMMTALSEAVYNALDIGGGMVISPVVMSHDFLWHHGREYTGFQVVIPISQDIAG